MSADPWKVALWSGVAKPTSRCPPGGRERGVHENHVWPAVLGDETYLCQLSNGSSCSLLNFQQDGVVTAADAAGDGVVAGSAVEAVHEGFSGGRIPGGWVADVRIEGAGVQATIVSVAERGRSECCR